MATQFTSLALPIAPIAFGGAGFYPAGHWLPQNMAMQAILPRPDIETGSFASTNARYRWAYYDAVNQVPYECQVSLQGGSRPFVLTLLAGPPGSSIGRIWGASNYGIVTWQPTQVYTTGAPAVFTVLVQGQDGNFTTVTWTVATSSTKFLFVDSVNGNDGNSGAFNTPFQHLSAVIGSTTTTTTFPGAIIYLKAGNYQWPTQTGAGTGYTQLDLSKSPVVFLAIPGATINIDASLTQIVDGSTSACTDMWWSGSTTSRMIIDGSGPAADTHTFEIYNSNRLNLWNVDFTNPISRANGSNTNSSSLYTANGGIGMKQYYTLLGCTESGRVAGAGNSMLLTSCFSVKDMLIDSCQASGVAGFGPFIKDSNTNVTVFNGLFNFGGASGIAFAFGCQRNNQTSGNLELLHSIVTGGGVYFDFQNGNPAGTHWSGRNTIYRTDTNNPWGLGNFGPSGTGPYYTINDVIIAKSPGGIQASGGVPFIASGTEVQVAWSGSPPPSSNNPINTSTFRLVNSTTAWKTLYDGTRGHWIG